MFTDLSSNVELLELKNNKKRAELYLRALWGEGFNVIYDDADTIAPCSYIIGNTIHLPDYSSLSFSFARYVRAASVHAGLHRIYGGAAYDGSDLNFMQRTVVGLVEDLRVELLAIRQFPGLKKLWLDFHPDIIEQLSAQNLMLRLSRSVLAPETADDHRWVQKGRSIILEERDQLDSHLFSLQAGLSLANDLGQMRLPLNSGRYEPVVIYRDDNRLLWQKTIDSLQQADVSRHTDASDSYSSKLQETSQGLQVDLADENKLGSDSFYIRKDDKDNFQCQQSFSNKLENTFFYPEWDYRSHVLKKDWCAVLETESKPGSMEIIEERLNANKFILARLRKITIAMQVEKRRRIRKVDHGEEIDLDPFVEAALDIRRQKMPNDRVFMRNDYKHAEPVAISILMDLSESTNALVDASQLSISQIMRDAVLLLGETLSLAGEKFSMSGFSSKGRHEVNYIHYKKFDETFDSSKGRFADLNAQYSTRLGAAIRHCGYYLKQQEASKKVLLVITDGAPSDIDVYDERYLENDSREAVGALKKYGIRSFGLNLDSRSDRVIEHIFGKRACQTLDHINKLPQMLAYLYLSQLRY